MKKPLKIVTANKLALTNLATAFALLLVGGFFGLLQGLNRAGVLTILNGLNYYEMLSLHGVLLILAFTTLFMNGYLWSAVDYVLGGLTKGIKTLGWVAYGLFMFGAILVVIMIVAGEATVLYTFYAPMAANPWFYIGLVFVVLNIWMSGLGVFILSLIHI